MANIGKKILIVDDLKSYLWVLSQTFIQEGFIVFTAENGEEGLALAMEEKPDLILSDITMPKMDGLTMVKKLKEANISTPIIFLTNMSDIKNISAGLENSKDYIVKSDKSVEEVVLIAKEKLYIK